MHTFLDWLKNSPPHPDIIPTTNPPKNVCIFTRAGDTDETRDSYDADRAPASTGRIYDIFAEYKKLLSKRWQKPDRKRDRPCSRFLFKARPQSYGANHGNTNTPPPGQSRRSRKRKRSMPSAPPAFAGNVEDIGPPPIDPEDNQYAVERLPDPKSTRAASISAILVELLNIANSMCVWENRAKGGTVRKMV